jgi:non-ribosomal peptide synthase protein (TIGR01720 family)
LDDKVTQFNRSLNSELFSFIFKDLSNDNDWENKIKIESNKLQTMIDLTNGPLIKVALFRTDEGDHLLIIIHHLIVDGVSWRIILEDFDNLYKKHLNNEKLVLHGKTSSYKKWTDKLIEYTNGDNLKGEVEYWAKILNNKANVFISDFEVNEYKKSDCREIVFSLNKEYTDKLLKEVNNTFNTNINDILITSLGLAIKQLIREDKILISLEGHGRERISDDIDISRTVGWFTSIYPFMIDMTNSDDLTYQIKLVKEDMRKIPNKGIGYGILKYLSNGKYNDVIDFNNEPQVCFNYLGQLDQDMNTEIFNKSKILPENMVSKNSEKEYPIEFNSMVVDGVLKFTISFNGKEFTGNKISELAYEFEKKLIEVIDFCMKMENSEVTPSDLGDGNLSIEDLNNIYNLLS